MRINREILLKLAAETVEQRTHNNRDVVSAYLTGSLLEENHLLGGTTDIDLVIIHNSQPATEREIVRLSDDIHLDIAHHSVVDYRQPRVLRLHPWLGPAVYRSPILPHDKQHWFEFTQASVRDQFNRPDNVLNRSRQLYQSARDMWAKMPEEPSTKPSDLLSYLKILKDGANAVSSLVGYPLTERRFLVHFPIRAQAVGKPGLAAGLFALLGAGHVDADYLQGCIPQWEAAYAAAGQQPSAPPRLHAQRRNYYRKAFDALISSEHPQSVLWPLLTTWALSINNLSPDSTEAQSWQAALEKLEIMGDHFPERLAALDRYLDTVEETLEVWGKGFGI